MHQNFVMCGNALRVKKCSGSNMQSLVEIFNYLSYFSFTELHFVNSDVKDSDTQNLKGMNQVDCLRLYNCPNITDQGVTILVQNINPNCLTVSYCPNITNDGIQTCKDIINAKPKPSPMPNPRPEKPNPKPAKPKPEPKPEPKPAKPKPEPVSEPKPASSINELITQCVNKGERNL